MREAEVALRRGADRASSPAPFSSPALVARDAELARLTEAVTNPPAVVLVEGEAGVGKTRLVRELLAQPELRELRRLVGGSHPVREPLPFGPLIDALRRMGTIPATRELSGVAGALRPLIPELAEQLPPRLEPLGDPRAERHRVFRAILEVLGALGPAVCVLVDLHWCDDGTGDLLRFLVSQLPDECSLVLTYRREELSQPAAVLGVAARMPLGVTRTRLALAPLGPDQVRQLMTAILQVEDVSDEFAAYLHERTLGLPFAVEEVLGLLKDRHDLVQLDGRWARRTLDQLEVPEAVRDLTLERLARFSGDAVRIANAAAVVGVPAPADLLQRVAGISAARTARAASELLAPGLLREDDDRRLGFRHVLARQAVYEAIAAPERRQLHLRAALALERATPPLPLARIAHHFKTAVVPRKWIRYAEAAADLALSLGNTSAACDLLAEALVRPEASAAARARMAVKLGRATLGSLDHGRAMPVLRRLLDDASLPASVRGEVRLYVGLVLDNQAGQASAGLAEIARAAAELRRRPGLSARAMSVLAVPMSIEGHLYEHLAWMNRAVEAAARADDPVLRTAVLVNRATVLMHVGDRDAWRAVLDIPQEATTIDERRQLLRASGNLAHACTCIGHYRHAERFAARGTALSAEEGESYLAVALETTGVLLDWVRGHWAELEGRARKLAQGMEDVPSVHAEAEVVIGHLLLARGELAEAETHLASARDIGRVAGSIPVVMAAAAGLARLRLARGDSEGATEDALAELGLVRAKGIWVWSAEIAPVAVEALVARGREAEATALVAEIAKGVRGRDVPVADAALAVCRALLAAAGGRREQAVRTFARAERAWAALPRPYEAARCRETRALLLLAAGESRGRELLVGAAERFAALGATWDAARVRRSLREHGVVRTWRGGRRGYGDRLSPREAEVARLAAAGRTNREIAEALVLSPRTVEDHLAKARRKLGAGSRKALAGTFAT